MEKNYRYAIRKTTLGVGSVAIAAFLAGQVQGVEAAEAVDPSAITANQPAGTEAASNQPSDTGIELPLNEALNTAAPTARATARDGVATTDDGQEKQQSPILLPLTKPKSITTGIRTWPIMGSLQALQQKM